RALVVPVARDEDAQRRRARVALVVSAHEFPVVPDVAHVARAARAEPLDDPPEDRRIRLPPVLVGRDRHVGRERDPSAYEFPLDQETAGEDPETTDVELSQGLDGLAPEEDTLGRGERI